MNPRDYTFLGFSSDDRTTKSMLKAEWTDAEPVTPALS